MKLTITFLTLLFTNFLFSQNPPVEIAVPYDSTEGKYQYQEVVELEGLSTEQFYKNAKEWLEEKYVETDLLRDEENTIIIDEGYFNIVWVMDFGQSFSELEVSKEIKLTFNLKLEFKDGRYRYTITDMRSGEYGEVTLEGLVTSSYDQVNQDIPGLSKRQQRKVLEGQIKNLEELGRIMDEKFQSEIAEMKKAIKEGTDEDDW
ncbi:DUF4468 domain-containing protein [Halocola ammonii]